MLENNVEVIFDAKSENESFARVVAAAFVTKLDPTLEEISDIKQQCQRRLLTVLSTVMREKRAKCIWTFR